MHGVTTPYFWLEKYMFRRCLCRTVGSKAVVDDLEKDLQLELHNLASLLSKVLCSFLSSECGSVNSVPI